MTPHCVPPTIIGVIKFDVLKIVSYMNRNLSSDERIKLVKKCKVMYFNTSIILILKIKIIPI